MLLLVTVGLFTMHTLGHFSPHCPHQEAVQAAGQDDDPGRPLGSIVMCVAILCALTLLAVAVLAARRLRLTSLMAQRFVHPTILPVRGPPHARPIGLTLTDLAVLRT